MARAVSSTVSLLARVGSCVLLALTCALSAAAENPPAPDADHSWQVILEQSAGPGTRFQNQEEAMAAMRRHLDEQEGTLRSFIRSFPADPRRYSARIRLAAVLAAEGRLLKQPPRRTEGQKILADLESDPATPAPVRADAGFERVSEDMQDAAGHADAGTRDNLLNTVRAFDALYPDDRRTAGLLTELATLYDDDPTRKKALLDEAFTRAGEPALRQRIDDDRRRLALLDRPLSIRLQPWQGGAPIDLAARRGRVEVLLFWASWSLPSLHELAELERTAKDFAGQPVDFLTVSLDEDPKALAATIEAANLRWPVHCDGHGWKGELVRSLGLNALPTVWVLDRQGNLLALNARGEQAATLIHRALAP